MKTISRIISVVFILCLVSCSAEDGDDGMDGNANVISSDWITINFSPTPNTFKIQIIDDSNISEANVNSAAFQVYARTASGDVYTIPHEFGNRSYFYSLSAADNQLTFRAESINNSMEVFSDFTEIRYTIIPSN
ncbi:hypothetical protein [Psychroserpens luteolus]|uniref:hypothetical protein n=1 Tax=Psychroserpens luteolus TaxID=2855840 RepID=UPI001E42868A|nr:hypothetical protein [Psychroserpens luteolus]MCD2258473.1 hypothetical protein [Psychroserpens luteolus]